MAFGNSGRGGGTPSSGGREKTGGGGIEKVRKKLAF